MALDLVKTLSDLISLPSVNPMGRDLQGPEFLEHQVTDYLESLFQRLDVEYLRQPVEPQRDNIIARINGRQPADAPGSLLLFEAHQDTVPVDGMTIPPWTPLVRDGRIYGRGSCDIKGGMVAMLGAFARLAAERPAHMPTLIMACTVNEEHGYTGATALTQLWRGEGAIVARRPDAAVIAEPTRLDVVVAHKGTVRWRAHTHGHAVHSSQPHLGDNAIYKMSRLLTALEAYQRDVAPGLPEHRLCGKVTLSVGTIHGGISVNTVPDRCTIEIDRRVLPGETRESAYRHVIEHVTNYPGVDFEVEHESPFLEGEPLPDGANTVLAERLATISRSLGGRGECIGVPFGTDAAQIALAGVPSVVFGPGSIDQAHTADEWLPLDELHLASEALYQLASQGIG